MRLNTILSHVAVLSIALCASAQQPTLQAGPQPAAASTLAPATMPVDKLLAFAVAHNGAGEVPGDGWHLKGTFEYNTSQVGDERFVKGSFDETWYGPQNYTKTYEYKGVSHTDTATPDGLFRSGDQGWDTPEEVIVRKLLVNPLPTDPLDPGITLIHQDVATGKATVPCLFEVYKMAPGLSAKEQKEEIDRSPRICFDPAAPIMLFAAGIGSQAQAQFSKIKNLGGHLVATEITLTSGTVPSIKVHVQEASVPPPPTGVMPIPPGAKKLESPVTVAWETISPYRIPNPREPIFPAGAYQEHLEGDVNIALVIAPDGTVTSAKIVDGIQMFREYALDFLKKSKFKPFLISGTPVEVLTTATIHFSMAMGMRQRRGGGDGPDCSATPTAPGCTASTRAR